MITDEMIQEINYLSRKQRSEGLNDEEKQRHPAPMGRPFNTYKPAIQYL